MGDIPGQPFPEPNSTGPTIPVISPQQQQQQQQQQQHPPSDAAIYPQPAYSMPYGGYGSYGGYGGYGMGYGGYGMMPGGGYGRVLDNVLGGSGRVVGGVRLYLAQIARFSGLLEEVLRSVHGLFEAFYILATASSAVKSEVAKILGKGGIVAVTGKMLGKVGGLWKLLFLILVSPMGGRYSPVAMLLKWFGLVPNADSLEEWEQDVEEARPEEGRRESENYQENGSSNL